VRFLLLLYGDESKWAEASPEDLQGVMNAYEVFSREVVEAGAFVAGEGLDLTSAARTLRVRDGQELLTDGPFAETREQLGGFYVLDCKDIDEALGWAAKIPDVTEGCVEVRPVMDYEAAGYEAPEYGRAEAKG
jgi:hypothetical protein